jgi:predicted RNase H-like nuclease
VSNDRVLGVDACKAGWVGVALAGVSAQAYVAADIATLVSLADRDGALVALAIDMPIGLPDHGPRQADVLARAAIGSLRSSVFQTPVRDALLAEDHVTANAVSRRLTGTGVSIQAFSLKAKLLDVQAFIQEGQHRIIEVHPEVSFARLAGKPLTTRKSTWAGMQQRQRLLTSAGIDLDQDFGIAGALAGVDDMLDAAIAAWTARRYVAGEARPLPDPPETFTDGLPSAIWA